MLEMRLLTTQGTHVASLVRITLRFTLDADTLLICGCSKNVLVCTRGHPYSGHILSGFLENRLLCSQFFVSDAQLKTGGVHMDGTP